MDPMGKQTCSTWNCCLEDDPFLLKWTLFRGHSWILGRVICFLMFAWKTNNRNLENHALLTHGKGHLSTHPFGDVVLSFSQSLLVFQKIVLAKWVPPKNDAYAYDGGNRSEKIAFLFYLGSKSYCWKQIRLGVMFVYSMTCRNRIMQAFLHARFFWPEIDVLYSVVDLVVEIVDIQYIPFIPYKKNQWCGLHPQHTRFILMNIPVLHINSKMSWINEHVIKTYIPQPFFNHTSPRL